jgi:putative methyltransferase (TIGR04325 family)
MENALSTCSPTALPGTPPPARPSVRSGRMPFPRLRLAQIRATSLLVEELTRLGPLAALLARVRHWPLARPFLNLLAGYNRVFPDLATARQVAARYDRPGADSAEDTAALQTFLATTWPSDYPVLLHLARLPLEGLRVFDLGGTMGDLFYHYDRYLAFPASVRWTVHDLPGNMDLGRARARRQGETRVQFSDDLHGASGNDVLLVSGALHYFDFALGDYLKALAQPPQHVLVNRTPLVDQPTAATVQYTGKGVMVACRLLNRAELITGMERSGYQLVDSWRTSHGSLKMPYDRGYQLREYSGLYFRAVRS